MLAILDAETAVIEAESAVRLARIDAAIPADATRQLDHDQDQLDLKTAEHALARAQATLRDKQEQHAKAQPVTEMAVARPNRIGTACVGHSERPRSGLIAPGFSSTARIPSPAPRSFPAKRCHRR